MEQHDSCDFFKFSSYLHEIISKTQNFCTYAQENHLKLLKLQRKLKVYEKFEDLDTLSAMNLQKLEKHLEKGLDLVKDERIRRKYEKKLKVLQEKLGICKENVEKPEEKSQISYDFFNLLCEDLRFLLKKFEDFKKELETLRQWPAQNYEKIVTTLKKTRHFSFGQLHFEETIEKNMQNYHNIFTNTSHLEENIQTKVSNFNENSYNNNNNFNINLNNNESNKNIANKSKGELFLIREILNSKPFALQIEGMHKTSHIAETSGNEELSPDFQVKSSKSLKTQEKILENMYNSINDAETNSGKRASLSDIPLTESLEISLMKNEDKNEKKSEKKTNNIECKKEISNNENNYLRKLKKKMQIK